MSKRCVSNVGKQRKNRKNGLPFRTDTIYNPLGYKNSICFYKTKVVQMRAVYRKTVKTQ